MNDGEKPNLFLRYLLICIAAVIMVVGSWLFFFVNQKNAAVQFLADFLMPAAIILIGLMARKRPRRVVTDPAAQARLKQQSRMVKVWALALACVSFMLTPVFLRLQDPKFPAFLLWYSVATGFICFVGLCVWFRKKWD